jgi:L-fuculose-phosphate aldolase
MSPQPPWVPHPPAVLVNHGIVTVGPTLRAATVAAIILEHAARQQWITRGFGTQPTCSPPEESLAKRDHILRLAPVDQVWDYLVRRCERST